MKFRQGSRLHVGLLWIVLLGAIQPTPVRGTDLIEGPGFDLSDDQHQPTLFALTPGTNILGATTGGPVIPGGGSTNGNDAEFVGVTVPHGWTLGSIELLTYDHALPGNRVFIAYESGSLLLSAPISDYLNGIAPEPVNTLFGFPEVGLPIWLDLGPGPFAFWIQETNPFAATYTLRFNVVPEPSSLAWLIMGLALLVRSTGWYR